MNLPLIGFCGQRQSGKDTAANYLIKRYGYTRQAFADALKFDVWTTAAGMKMTYSGWLEFVDANKENPDHWVRPLLQAWGSMRRDLFGEGYWVRQVTLEPRTAISDTRYPNEVDAIKEAGGVLIRLERTRHSISHLDLHSSETHVPSLEVDYVIHNNGTIAD